MIACISGALGPLEEPRQREVNLATATAIRFFQGLPPHVLLAFLFLLFVLTFFIQVCHGVMKWFWFLLAG